MSRPRESFGPVAQTMVQAARQQPGTVRQLAERTQIGYDVARYTAHRLVAGGVLQQTDDRPAILGPATPRGVGAGADLSACLRGWVGAIGGSTR